MNFHLTLTIVQPKLTEPPPPSSAVANAIVFPMDLVTTRLQIAKDTP